MPSNPSLARDEVFGFFTAEFVDLPKPCDLRYQGKIDNRKTGPYWVRLSMQTVMTGEAGFVMTDEPDPSPMAFETSGLIYAQVFAAIGERDAFHFGGLLAVQARNLFRRAGTASGVWFRNARSIELPLRDGDKEFRWNVVVEYEYNEMKP